jgi:hypothetical protein
MIEIRWVDVGGGNLQLQQRSRGFQVDASGAFCGLTAWSEWEAVPIVHASGAVVSRLPRISLQCQKPVYGNSASPHCSLGGDRSE